jgi:ketosteroid isomerase-like protein
MIQRLVVASLPSRTPMRGVPMRYQDDVVKSMCDAYAAAVNAGDSEAYRRLFTPTAIRVPPGAELEYGPDEIQKGEQSSYDQGSLTIRSTPVDVVGITDDWIYALANVDGEYVAHADGSRSTFRATKAWLLQRQPSGEWLLARHMWNMRP